MKTFKEMSKDLEKQNVNKIGNLKDKRTGLKTKIKSISTKIDSLKAKVKK